MFRPLILIMLTLCLSACGFHLRSFSSQISLIDNINIISKSKNNALSNKLIQTFKNNHVEFNPSSPYKLTVEKSQFNKRVATVSDNARAAEYEISLSVIYSFAMDLPENNEESSPLTTQTVLHAQAIQLSRSFYYSQTQIAAMQKEESLIRSQMNQTAAHRILDHVRMTSNAFLEKQAGEKITAKHVDLSTQ